uniref:Uncharacterized protein n=1 Tax=Glossina pallidipes TaxID=7398 RepID=A0A1A9ZCJ6_GLOPL
MPFHFRPKNDYTDDVNANILERTDALYHKPREIIRKCQQTWVSARQLTERLSYRPSNCREVIQHARRRNKEMYPRKGSYGALQQTRKRTRARRQSMETKPLRPLQCTSRDETFQTGSKDLSLHIHMVNEMMLQGLNSSREINQRTITDRTCVQRKPPEA